MPKTTHCRHGHERTPENIYVAPKTGAVGCMPCRRSYSTRKGPFERGIIYFDKRYFGGNRERAILRDGEKCVNCGMTRKEHVEIFGCDISVDHIDGTGTNTPTHQKNNSMDNLQTLCISCHGRKDGTRRKGATTKLTPEDAQDIRNFRSKGLKPFEIWRAYQMVTYNAVWDVAANKSHKEHVK